MLAVLLRPACWLPALLLASAGVLAQSQPQASLGERDQARAERAALQEQIRGIEQGIRSAEQQRSAAVDALRQSEQGISEATRRLAELTADGKRLETEQADLRRRQGRLDADLQKRRAELARLLREQYQQGGDSPWSALLSGGDPNDAGRRLAYLGYLARARVAMVDAIDREQAELAEVGQALVSRQAEWERVHAEQSAQREERVRQQAERQKVLDRIGDQLAVQRTQADRLKSDAERLSDLITNINQALASQAAERARREAEARARAEAERQAQAAAERQAVARREAAEREAAAAARALVPEPVDPLGLRPDEMASAPQPRPAPDPAPGRAGAGGTTPTATLAMRGGGDSTPPPPASAPPRAPASAVAPPSPPAATTADDRRRFSQRRGQLPRPMSGEVAGRFGEDSPAGGTWRGIFVPAKSGAQVRAVASGTAVFSGWLRGFGNLLILDHGDDYLTVYGSAEAILKQVGDQVRGGEVVATAGSTGGMAQSGLYFEIRHRGNPVDPLPWMN